MQRTKYQGISAALGRSVVQFIFRILCELDWFPQISQKSGKCPNPPHFRGGEGEKEIYVHFGAALLNIDQPIFPWVLLPCHLLSPIFSPQLGSFQRRGRRNVSVDWAGLGIAAPLPSRNNVAANKCPRDPGLCSCPWGTNQESPPWGTEPMPTNLVFPTTSQSSWNPFQFMLVENPRWGCRFFLASHMLFQGWATPVSNWEVDWEQWHLQTLGIAPCCEARPRHLDDISLLAFTSQKNLLNTPSLWFMRAKYSLAPQKLLSVQWVNGMWLTLRQMSQIDPSPRLPLIFLWLLRYVLKQSCRLARFRKCQMMDLGHSAFFYDNHMVQR